MEKIKLTTYNTSCFRVLNFYYSFLSGTFNIFNSSFGQVSQADGFRHRVLEWKLKVGKTGEWIPGGQFGKQKSILYLTTLHMRKRKFPGELGRALWASPMGDRMKKQV